MRPWCLLTAVAERLPERWADGLGRLLGFIAFSVIRVRRGVVERNLRQALDLAPAEVKGLARRVYHHLGRGAVEFLRVGALTPQRARALLGEGALGQLERLRRERGGVLVLGAHLGNWDLLACAAGRAGLPINVVTRRIKAGWLDRFWSEQRRRCGVRLLPARGSALALLRALRRGELVAMLLDQHQPGGAALPFLGRPAATDTALVRLARATGCPVIPAFLLREGAGFRLHLGQELRLRWAGGGAAEVAENTRRCLEALEAAVRSHPEQWLWLHRRWKIPAGTS